jgi:hypothetical protein
MIRMMISALLAAVVGFTGSNAAAEIYRCRDAGGVLFFTDNPAHFPPGCRQEAPGDRQGALSVVPETPAPANVSGAEEFLRRSSREAEEQSRQVRQWKDEAESLAGEYRQALALRYETMRVSEKRKVFRRIGEIKERRDALVEELAEAHLPLTDKNEIKKTLAVIPP